MIELKQRKRTNDISQYNNSQVTPVAEMYN